MLSIYLPLLALLLFLQVIHRHKPIRHHLHHCHLKFHLNQAIHYRLHQCRYRRCQILLHPDLLLLHFQCLLLLQFLCRSLLLLLRLLLPHYLLLLEEVVERILHRSFWFLVVQTHYRGIIKDHLHYLNHIWQRYIHYRQRYTHVQILLEQHFSRRVK